MLLSKKDIRNIIITFVSTIVILTIINNIKTVLHLTTDPNSHIDRNIDANSHGDHNDIVNTRVDIEDMIKVMTSIDQMNKTINQNRKIDKLIDKQLDKEVDIKIDKLIDKQVDKQVDKQIDKRIDEQITTQSNANSNIKHKSTYYNDIISSSIQCTNEITNKYDNISNDLSNINWCNTMKSSHNVIIGRSWGTLNKQHKLQWDIKECNELLKLNRLQSCNEKYGWKYLMNWINTKQSIISNSYSNVNCIINLKTSTLCQIKKGIIDYSKSSVSGNVRNFMNGFVKLYGKSNQATAQLLPIPGIQFINQYNDRDIKCDEIEKRPTIIYSNDDIFNLGHYMNDVMAAWSMIVLSNNYPNNSLLINMDGVRNWGPAGGPPHRIMDISQPDNHGPFSIYHETWFNEIKKGISYKKKSVCYNELYFQVLPGVPWWWLDWNSDNYCSYLGPSPLYQSFNLFIRSNIEMKYPNSLKYNHNTITILFNIRKNNKNNKLSSSRVILNIKELVKSIQSIEGVNVIVKDFSELTFLEQIKLSYSSSIFIGMHGAGGSHVVHAPIGQKNCCAFIELFPDKTVEFYHIHGIGNLARMLGLHSYRYVSPTGSTKSSGTVVEIDKIKELVIQAVNDVKYQPTCLHDVRDTTIPIFDQSPFDY